ncbi:MAG: SDR family oxidoreductase [Anaerolineae bacterium]
MPNNHVVIITGAASGIGRALAETYRRDGSTVILADIASGALDDLARELGCITMPTDVRVEGDLKRLVNGTRKRFGQIDVYINNAGLGYDGPVAEGNLTEWREMIDTNLWGVMIGTREALKIMRRQHRGDIVFVDSQAGRTPLPNMAVYAATKWGVRGFAEVVWRESFVTNVRVIVVEPGGVATHFFDAITPAGRAQVADGPLLTPQQVAEMVVFATSQDERVLVHEIKLGAVSHNGGNNGRA